MATAGDISTNLKTKLNELTTVPAKDLKTKLIDLMEKEKNDRQKRFLKDLLNFDTSENIHRFIKEITVPTIFKLYELRRYLDQLRKDAKEKITLGPLDFQELKKLQRTSLEVKFLDDLRKFGNKHERDAKMYVEKQLGRSTAYTLMEYYLKNVVVNSGPPVSIRQQTAKASARSKTAEVMIPVNAGVETTAAEVMTPVNAGVEFTAAEEVELTKLENVYKRVLAFIPVDVKHIQERSLEVSKRMFIESAKKSARRIGEINREKTLLQSTSLRDRLEGRKSREERIKFEEEVFYKLYEDMFFKNIEQFLQDLIAKEPLPRVEFKPFRHRILDPISFPEKLAELVAATERAKKFLLKDPGHKNDIAAALKNFKKPITNKVLKLQIAQNKKLDRMTALLRRVETDVLFIVNSIEEQQKQLDEHLSDPIFKSKSIARVKNLKKQLVLLLTFRKTCLLEFYQLGIFSEQDRDLHRKLVSKDIILLRKLNLNSKDVKDLIEDLKHLETQIQNATPVTPHSSSLMVQIDLPVPPPLSVRDLEAIEKNVYQKRHEEMDEDVPSSGRKRKRPVEEAHDQDKEETSGDMAREDEDDQDEEEEEEETGGDMAREDEEAHDMRVVRAREFVDDEDSIEYQEDEERAEDVRAFPTIFKKSTATSQGNADGGDDDFFSHIHNFGKRKSPSSALPPTTIEDEDGEESDHVFRRIDETKNVEEVEMVPIKKKPFRPVRKDDFNLPRQKQSLWLFNPWIENFRKMWVRIVHQENVSKNLIIDKTSSIYYKNVEFCKPSRFLLDYLNSPSSSFFMDNQFNLYVINEKTLVVLNVLYEVGVTNKFALMFDTRREKLDRDFRYIVLDKTLFDNIAKQYLRYAIEVSKLKMLNDKVSSRVQERMKGLLSDAFIDRMGKFGDEIGLTRYLANGEFIKNLENFFSTFDGDNQTMSKYINNIATLLFYIGPISCNYRDFATKIMNNNYSIQEIAKIAIRTSPSSIECDGDVPKEKSALPEIFEKAEMTDEDKKSIARLNRDVRKFSVSLQTYICFAAQNPALQFQSSMKDTFEDNFTSLLAASSSTTHNSPMQDDDIKFDIDFDEDDVKTLYDYIEKEVEGDLYIDEDLPDDLVANTITNIGDLDEETRFDMSSSEDEDDDEKSTSEFKFDMSSSENEDTPPTPPTPQSKKQKTASSPSSVCFNKKCMKPISDRKYKTVFCNENGNLIFVYFDCLQCIADTMPEKYNKK